MPSRGLRTALDSGQIASAPRRIAGLDTAIGTGSTLSIVLIAAECGRSPPADSSGGRVTRRAGQRLAGQASYWTVRPARSTARPVRREHRGAAGPRVLFAAPPSVQQDRSFCPQGRRVCSRAARSARRSAGRAAGPCILFAGPRVLFAGAPGAQHDHASCAQERRACSRPTRPVCRTARSVCRSPGGQHDRAFCARERRACSRPTRPVCRTARSVRKSAGRTARAPAEQHARPPSSTRARRAARSPCVQHDRPPQRQEARRNDSSAAAVA
jgi:hypothetical protein